MTPSSRFLRLAFPFAIVAGSVTLATSSRADEAATPSVTTAASSQPVSDAPATEARWYGYQTLATDAAAVAFGVIAATADAETPRAIFATIGLATFVAGGPVVHLSHGHGTKALVSAGVRTVTPVAGFLLGALIGAATASNDAWFGKLGGTIAGAGIGAVSGVVAASVIDAIALARDTVPSDASPAPPPPPVATLSPTLAVGRDTQQGPSAMHATVGVVGRF